MAIRFKALRDFSSREFKGTVYAKGMTYTIREGNQKLADMTSRWLKAQLFKVNEDLEMFGSEFKAGSTSYSLEGDAFKDVVDAWVNAGKAEYVQGSLITFDVGEAPSGITGG